MSRRTNTLLAASAFAVLLAAGPAAAWAHEEGSAWAEEEGHGRAVLQALSNAKVSLQQAVVTAQQKTVGHAFEATIEQDNGAAVYWIATVANGGKIAHLRVDPVSGAVLMSPGLAVVGPEQQQDASLAAGTKLSLAEAIQAASARAQGPVIDASLNNENGRAMYQVAIAAPGRIQQFNVDPTSGTVTVSMQGPDHRGEGGHGDQGGHQGPEIEGND